MGKHKHKKHRKHSHPYWSEEEYAERSDVEWVERDSVASGGADSNQDYYTREPSESEVYGPALPPELTEEPHSMKKRLESLTAVVSDMVTGNEVDVRAVHSLVKQSAQRSYKDRAKAAVASVGMELEEEEMRKKSALSNPLPLSQKPTTIFPVVPMVQSRVENTWKDMCGLKKGESWDPESLVPPPNPPKSLKAHKVKETMYSVKRGIYPSKGYEMDPQVKVNSGSSAKVPLSKLAEWEKNLCLSLNIANMMDIFTAEIYKNTVDKFVELKNNLPVEFHDMLLPNIDDLQMNFKSKAKALEDFTEVTSWQLGDMVMVHREAALEHYVKKDGEKLSEQGKTVLKMQPLNGPLLFGGKVKEVLEKDSKEATGKAVRSLVMDRLQSQSGKKSNDSFRDYYSRDTSKGSYSYYGTGSNSGYRRGSYGSSRGRGPRRGYRSRPYTNQKRDSRSDGKSESKGK